MSETEASKELRSVSPSSIDTFDDTTPFGCNRKWWFKYPGGKPEEEKDNLKLGLALHYRNEKYLEAGLVFEAGQALAGFSDEHTSKSYGLFERGRPWLDANLKNTANPLKFASWLEGVEQTLPEGFTVGGLRISRQSKCDVVLGGTGPAGILDWKTTSDRKWMKTPTQLKKNTQMLIYADAFHRARLTAGEKVTLTHGYYVTKGAPAFTPVSAEIGIAELDERLAGHIIPLVGEMKKTYLAPTARDVKPNRQICWNCSYRGICPSDKVNPLMGIFSKKFSGSGEAKVTPPDAPASDPAKAAEPVEGKDVPPAVAEKVRRMNIVDGETGKPIERASDATKVESKADRLKRELAEAEAEERAEAERLAAEAAKKAAEAAAAAKVEGEKRGPGRPPGSKNKATLAKEAREALAENGPVFTKTTVTFGATMNMGDYNNVRVDVSHTIEYADGDAEAAFEEACKLAKTQVEAELAKLQPEKK